jgi:hypothetical protein
VVGLLEEYAATDLTPTQVHKAIERELNERNMPERALPVLRTVAAHLKEYRSRRDPSGPWKWADAGAEEARLVFEALVDVAEHGGYLPGLTKAHAELVAKVRSIAPDLPARYAVRVAREYLRCEASGQSADHLDGLLIFQPWRSKEASKRYCYAVSDNLVQWPGRVLAEGLVPEGWDEIDEWTVVFDRKGGMHRVDYDEARIRRTTPRMTDESEP